MSTIKKIYKEKEAINYFGTFTTTHYDMVRINKDTVSMISIDEVIGMKKFYMSKIAAISLMGKYYKYLEKDLDNK